ncbi:type II toxin-antitoxin system HicA family toxin [Nocardiopsis alkaliphila]|uniref:type II toxin-antitoxin system HicA family toxin n=1 Tax=Nocardiopsis alkaliphila TaxID=225762 RepID=UPI0009FFE668|nr:type II toxin-antitoxin system HicA family toxin [Nocardiopsis alkaliphila]
MNQKELKRLLEEHGWRETIGGKHQVKMEKEGERPITLPMHKGKPYAVGLTGAILKQAGIKNVKEQGHE